MTPALAPPSPGDLLKRVERDVERAVRRGRNGLKYAAGTSRPRVGQTPKDVVWQRDKAQVWRYRTDDAVEWAPPVLAVHSLVSRSYVLDLQPRNSAVRFFKRAGLDVLLLDWGVADELEAENTLETYVDDYIPRAVAGACEATGSDEVTMLGYCFGGVLSLLSLARHPELPVRSLVLMATPVDFAGMPEMTRLVRDGRLEPDDLLDETGNVPPEAVENGFRMLTPTSDAVAYANLWQNLWNDQFVEGYQAMGQWIRDQVPFPGACFRQTVEQLIRRNALAEGGLRLGGEDVDLHRIGVPVLNVLAERDHIAPSPAVERVCGLLRPGQCDELRLDAGHVGLVMGREAAKVTLPRIVGWIQEHSDRAEVD